MSQKFFFLSILQRHSEKKWDPSWSCITDVNITYSFPLLENFSGTSFTPSVNPTLPSKTRWRHASFVSPSLSNSSTFQSRSSIAKKPTASTVANFLPMQARAPMLNAENSSESLDKSYQREGLYSSGSGKYRGLRSKTCKSKAMPWVVKSGIGTYGRQPCQLRPAQDNQAHGSKKKTATTYLHTFRHGKRSAAIFTRGVRNVQHGILTSFPNHNKSRGCNGPWSQRRTTWRAIGNRCLRKSRKASLNAPRTLLSLEYSSKTCWCKIIRIEDTFSDDGEYWIAAVANNWYDMLIYFFLNIFIQSKESQCCR